MQVATALLFGLATGLRTMTAPAAYFLHRGGIAGGILAVAALGEYVYDANPKAASRTRPIGVTARLLSGGITGWFVAGVPGIAAGAAGALAGCYGGHALRVQLIERTAPLPAALIEDALAIGLAFVAVSRL